MKICYVADGDNVITERWVNYFARHGYECHVISRNYHMNWQGEGYDDRVILHWLPEIIPYKWYGAGFINALFELFIVRHLVKKIKPDILHVHSTTRNAYLAVFSGFHPLVMSTWGSDVLISPKESFILKLLTQYSLRKADSVNCNGEYLMDETIRLGANRNKTYLIYHGVDVKKFQPRQNIRLTDNPVIISTRKLEPVYNVEMLIKALPSVFWEYPQTKVIIVGDGSQRKYLETLVSTLGVSSNVNFAGWLVPDNLIKCLQLADIYISTSLSDSASISLCEAMACGLAPIVTNIPSNSGWVEDGINGWLVSIGDTQMLADRIIQLIRNKSLRLEFGRKCREIIQSKANHEIEMQKMDGLYRELVK